MSPEYNFTVFPLSEVNAIDCDENLFATNRYLIALSESKPANMECFAVEISQSNVAVGYVFAQFLDLRQLESFGDRDRCIKTAVRDFLFRNFSSRVLFIGNNMLTGQHAFCHSDRIEHRNFLNLLKPAGDAVVTYLKASGKRVHVITYKDFGADDTQVLEKSGLSDYFRFSTQPNMILYLPTHWPSPDAYVSALNKKYRDQYKRARKKIAGVTCVELDLKQIISYRKEIYALYEHVARNAPFNTFFLAENHFESLKQNLGENFHLSGHFVENKLVGFKTLIKNGDILETYFLGYDDTVQKNHMLYLNMLYDMIDFGITHNFRKIVFARTALEIKSSVGAVPHQVFGFMKHNNKLIDKLLPYIFPRLEPVTSWQQRHPFK